MMKPFALCAAACLLTSAVPALACSPIAPEELIEFQQPGVPPALYNKIAHALPLSLSDIETLAQAHVHSGSIINYLYTWGRHFVLTEADVAELKRNHAPTDLISFMASADAKPPLLFF